MKNIKKVFRWCEGFVCNIKIKTELPLREELSAEIIIAF